MYNDTCKTTKFIDFKIQKYSLSMTIQYHSDTLFISEVAMTWLLSHMKYKGVLSHPIPWDVSHRNDIPMDKPVFLIYTLNHNHFVRKAVGFYVWSFRFRDLGLG